MHECYDNLFQWGQEVSTYKIFKYYPEIENNTIDISQYIAYMFTAENMAFRQKKYNNQTLVYLEDNISITWEDAYNSIIPYLRKNYIEYKAIYDTLENYPINYNCILNTLLVFNRIHLFFNLGKEVTEYLNYNLNYYRKLCKTKYSNIIKKLLNNL